RDFETMLELARSAELTADTPAAARARDVAFDYFEQPWRDAFGLFDISRLQNQDRSLGPTALECEAYWALTYILLDTGQLDEMATRAREFLALAESTRNEHRRLEALGWLALRELTLSDLDAVKRYVAEGLPAARAIPHERALYLFLDAGSRVHQLDAEYERAEQMCTETLPLTLEANGRVSALLGVGIARAHLGRVSAALTPLSQALDIAQRAGIVESVPMVTGVLGWLHGELGDFAGAVEHFTAASARAAAVGRADTEAPLRFQLARAHWALGDAASAHAEAARAEQLVAARPARRGAPSVSSMRRQLQLDAAHGEYRVASGELAAAETIGERLLHGALERRSPKHVAIARLLLAQAALGLGRPDSAQRHALAGLEVLVERPIPLVEWRLLATLATALQQTNDANSAADALARASAVLDRIERSIDDDRLRERWANARAVRALRAAAPAATAGGVRAAV
ncbi:MAG TPA: hypothetical protein VMG12_31030, partial [Polyangiaceae bacterium]|nr:hypothetical protein [Polyangiaceae bacterium]